MLNRGLTSFVLFPSLFNYLVLLRATLADPRFLKRTKYPVLVILMLATYIS
jgi:hypothetical protein